MSRRKVILSSIIVMVLSLVSIFSIGVFEHIMDLRDKSDATYYEWGYDFHSTTAISNADYKDNSYFGISNAEGLKGFLASCQDRTWEGKTIALNTNIDMNGYETEPAGSDEGVFSYSYTEFLGTLDGNYHTISNLKIKAPKDNGDPVYAGIFGKIGNCTIKEIRFYNCTVSNANEKDSEPLYMGIIAGSMSISSIISDCVIDSCTISNSADVTNLYTSPTAGGCIDDHDLVVKTISGYANLSWSLSVGGLQRVVVRNFTNNDSNGCRLGPEYVYFYLEYYVALYSSVYVVDTGLLYINTCVIGDNVAGSRDMGDIDNLSSEVTIPAGISTYNVEALATYPAIQSQIYDDANDYSRLTVANETTDPSGYTWYRSIIAFNDTPYLAAFVRNYIKIDACCNTDCVSTAYLHDKNGDGVSEVTTFSGEKRIYYPAGYERVYRCEHPVDFHLFDVGNAFLRANVKHPYDSFGVWNYAQYTEGEWTYWHITLTINHVDSYTVSFKPAQNNNLYLNSSETIKPYLFDTTDDSKPATSIYATTASDGTLNIRVPINSSLCNDATYPQTSYKYNDSTGGYVGVYTIHVKDTWYAVAYHFTEAVPNLSCAVHTATYPISITSNLDITTTFSGGYINVTFGAVDHATAEDLSSNGYVHRVAQGSEVTAQYDTENYTWIKYSIGGVEKIKYTCDDTYWISDTGLGSNLATSKTVSSNTTIAPTIKGQSDKRTLTFESVTVSDSVGNSMVYYPTYTKNGTQMGELKTSIELFEMATISHVEINDTTIGATGYEFTVRDVGDIVYVVRYYDSQTYQFTSYEYNNGIKQNSSDGQYYVGSTASVSVNADYKDLIKIKFAKVNGAYLYAPTNDVSYDANSYAKGEFGSEYMNGVTSSFVRFMNYKNSTYIVEIKNDSENTVKPTLRRILNSNDKIYTLTYVLVYNLDGVNRQAEVAQYMAENSTMTFKSDGYTEGADVLDGTTIKPVFNSAKAITFSLPSDETIATMSINGEKQTRSQNYLCGNTITFDRGIILNNSVIITSYQDINVSLLKNKFVYTFNSITITKSRLGQNKTVTTTQEVIYQMDSNYLNSAYLVPRYSDKTIPLDTTTISFSRSLTISPQVRTDYKIKFVNTTFTFGSGFDLNAVSPKFYKNGVAVSAGLGLIGSSSDFIRDSTGVTLSLPYGIVPTITFEKIVDLESNKNIYLFTIISNGTEYEIKYDIISYPSYKIINDLLTYDQSTTIDQDIEITMDMVLKEYVIG